MLDKILIFISGCTGETFSLEDSRFFIFALTSMLFGFICLLIDFLSYLTTKKSFLNIKYLKSNWFIFITWSLGALFVGYVGAIVELLDIEEIKTAFIVGVSWPFIFSKWAKEKLKAEDNQVETEEN